MFTRERHLFTPGQHEHSSQRHTAAGTAAHLTSLVYVEGYSSGSHVAATLIAHTHTQRVLQSSPELHHTLP